MITLNTIQLPPTEYVYSSDMAVNDAVLAYYNESKLDAVTAEACLKYAALLNVQTSAKLILDYGLTLINADISDDKTLLTITTAGKDCSLSKIYDISDYTDILSGTLTKRTFKQRIDKLKADKAQADAGDDEQLKMAFEAVKNRAYSVYSFSDDKVGDLIAGYINEH